MSILNDLRELFVKKEVVVEKQEDIGKLVSPLYKEIPPANKAGQYISEGFRSWCYIAISAIADELATQEYKLYKKVGDEWEEIKTDSPIKNLIDNPNPLQTKEEHFWITSAFYLAEGEAPWLLNDSKNPTEMICLNPSRLKPIAESKELDVKEYKYSQSNGTETIIPADELIFLKKPSTSTPFRGSGIPEHIAQSLDIDNYLEEYLRLFFFNDATPGAVLETDEKLSKNVLKRLKDQFKEKHEGYKNSHKLAIFEQGLKWKETSNKIADLQAIQITEQTRDKILSAFRVPKSIVGITQDVNRANGENEDRIFAKRALLPNMKFLQAQINIRLMEKFDALGQIKFEFDNPVEADRKLDAELDVMYINAGVFTVDEVRERMGMEPIEEEEQTPPNEAETEEVEETETEEEEKEPSDIFEKIVKDIMEDNKPKEHFTEEEKETFHKDKLALTDKIEDEYKAGLKEYFEKVGNLYIKQLAGKRKKQKFEFDNFKDDQVELLIKYTVPILRESIKGESRLAYAFLGLSDQLTPYNEDVKKYIDSRSNKVGLSVYGTNKKAVDRIVKQWNKDEGSIADLRQILTEYFGNAEKNRAETIARTEVSSANGFAQQLVYKKVGAIGKKWLTAEDERVCEFCAPMNDKFIPINRNFWNKGETMHGEDGGTLDFEYTGIKFPPLHAKCRCDLVPVFAEEFELGFEDEKDEFNKDDYKSFKKTNKKELDKKLELEAREKELKEQRINLKRLHKEVEAQASKNDITAVELEKNLGLADKKKKEINKELKEIQKYKEILNEKAK